ncbi:Mic26p [Sporobolomyces koalae]|uniref:Mic26p n=1 Tax=Sporobolomyces koalae TaxID=500713 RepID=UPI003176DD57
MPIPFVAKLLGGAATVTAASFAASSTTNTKPLLAQSTTPFSRPESVEQHRSKLSLYEKDSDFVTLVPEKSPLQDEVAQIRAVVQDATKGLRSSTADGRKTWLNWERQAEDSLQKIVSPKDQLNPGAMYVAVATLAGSILGRNRNLLVRAALPPAFLLFSLDYFLPHTAENVWTRARAFESAHLPEFQQARLKLQSLVGK